MILPTKLSLLKYAAINGIIAPHGITDIIHAQQNNLFGPLFTINGVTMLSSVVLDKLYLNNILDVSFILSSIIHFRRDFPENKLIPRYLFSSVLLFISIFYNPNILFFYMLFIHVPNHYRLNWKYLKSKKIQTISILSLSTTIFLIMGNELNFFTITPLVKSIIISHIIYEETFVYTSSTYKKVKNENKR